MKYQIILSLYCIFLFFFSCEGILDSTDHNLGTIYYNSFENESDLAGWQVISSINLVHDTPPLGGNFSLRISGGCIIPHASYTLPAAEKDMCVTIQCYGKNLLNGGMVELLVGNLHSQGINISISNTDWTFYKCDESMYCPADSTLTIYLISGGYVPSAMLIDMLEIVRVN